MATGTLTVTKHTFKPTRPVEWLKEYGWCIDNIEIGISTIPDAGRGAFARLPLQRGGIVAPAPLQVFRDRAVFKRHAPNSFMSIIACNRPTPNDILSVRCRCQFDKSQQQKSQCQTAVVKINLHMRRGSTCHTSNSGM